jgi:NAD(P)H-flavin reductase
MTTSTMTARLPVAAARHLSSSKSTVMKGAHAIAPRASAATAAPGRSAAFPARRRRHGMTVTPRAGWTDFEWGSAKVVSNKPASKEGGLHSIVLQVDAEMAKGYNKPGMFVQMRTSEDGKPAFIAIASAPDAASGEFELLVKSTEGTAGELCELADGAEVGVSPVMGKGFDLSGASAADCPTALLFATGSGISPIRALINSGELKARDVTLYYGTTSADFTAFSDEFATWEAAGVKVVNVNSPTYVQAALKEAVQNVDGGKTCAVLCGQKEMTEAVIELLTAAGVDRERCIMNF